jgi:putative two-component system response regulator
MRLRPLILLVEDDETQLQFAAAIIRSTDRYDVNTAQTAEEALKIAEQTKPDLIISDNYLPGETGVEFCKRIKGHPYLRNTMFMLLTSEQEVGHKILAVDLGADEYISKPYNADELLTRVRAWVRIAELQRELADESEELRWANELLQNTIDGVTNLLARVIAIRVPNASARADIAANMARWMAERLHLDADVQDHLELAARLHEIGKIALPDALLKKPYREYTVEEQNQLAEFALVSQRIMEGIGQFENLSMWMRNQLENFDGSGYPDKIRGRRASSARSISSNCPVMTPSKVR